MNALLSFDNQKQKMGVHIADLSRSGVRVYVGVPIARGTLVEIQYEGLKAQGIVWQSRKFREAFSIGIEFRWIVERNQNPSGMDFRELHAN